jgi:hypothetical protein
MLAKFEGMGPGFPQSEVVSETLAEDSGALKSKDELKFSFEVVARLKWPDS